MYRLFLAVVLFFCFDAECSENVARHREGDSIPLKRSCAEHLANVGFSLWNIVTYPLDMMHSACVRFANPSSLFYMGLAAWGGTLFSGTSAQMEPGLVIGQPEYLDCNRYKGHCDAFVPRDVNFISAYGQDAESDIFCENLWDEPRCEQFITWFDEDGRFEDCFTEVTFDQAASDEATEICRHHGCSGVYLALGAPTSETSFLECNRCPTDNRAFRFIYRPRRNLF